MNGATHAELSAELEAALTRELLGEYHRLNASHFKRRLAPPALMLSEVKGRLGRYDASSRTLEISRHMVLAESWVHVIEVLKHEMAHQFVLEVLLVGDETAHGPAFVEICQRLGIDARASGLPLTDLDGATEPTARVLERVARLLALAGSENKNEAEAAMNAAQRLMLKYNLDLKAQSSAAHHYAYKTLGVPTGRVSEAERALGTILGEFFFVEVIWVPAYRALEGKRGNVLEACGTPANLEMASYVHSFLSHAAERLWKEHKRTHGIRANRERRTFLAGVMSGFYAKLKRERFSQQEEGLVWMGDADLHGYYRKRHPNVATVRYGGQTRSPAHAHGRAAGQKLVLSKPVSGKASGTVRLLKR